MNLLLQREFCPQCGSESRNLDGSNACGHPRTRVVVPNDDIPAFLDRRKPNKEPAMTPAPAAEPKTRTKRQSAYIANIKAVAPLKEAEDLFQAMRALETAQAGLEAAGYTVTLAAAPGRI